MNISNERAKEILDNAPEGAEHYNDEEGVHPYLDCDMRNYWNRYQLKWLSMEGGRTDGALYALSALRAQLAQEVEWIEGDICNIDEYDGEWVYGCDVQMTERCIVFRLASSSHMIIPKCRLKKPETKDEKAARERVNNLDDMYGITRDMNYLDSCVALYDAGYRKVEVK